VLTVTASQAQRHRLQAEAAAAKQETFAAAARTEQHTLKAERAIADLSSVTKNCARTHARSPPHHPAGVRTICTHIRMQRLST
jgi:hypothetical protein